MPKEAKARILINGLVQRSGWRFFEDQNGPAKIALEVAVKLKKRALDALEEDLDQTASGFVGFGLKAWKWPKHSGLGSSVIRTGVAMIQVPEVVQVSAWIIGPATSDQMRNPVFSVGSAHPIESLNSDASPSLWVRQCPAWGQRKIGPGRPQR